MGIYGYIPYYGVMQDLYHQAYKAPGPKPPKKSGGLAVLE